VWKFSKSHAKLGAVASVGQGSQPGFFGAEAAFGAVHSASDLTGHSLPTFVFVLVCGVPCRHGLGVFCPEAGQGWRRAGWEGKEGVFGGHGVGCLGLHAVSGLYFFKGKCRSKKPQRQFPMPFASTVFLAPKKAAGVVEL
jgi:hypothetical protein